MPGRSFTSPADFNAQFADWLVKANTQQVRTVKAAPGELIDTDRAKMLPLPPVPLLGWSERVRLDGEVLANHARCWARGTTVTDPAHVAAAGCGNSTVTGDELVCDLADYDHAFGLFDGGEVA